MLIHTCGPLVTHRDYFEPRRHKSYSSPRHPALNFVIILIIHVLSGGDCAGFLSSYHSPLTAIAAASIYDLFPYLRHVSLPSALPALWIVDRLCFCVYLIHPVIIYGVYRMLGITPLSLGCSPIIAVLMLLALFVPLSLFVSWVLSKIPVIGKIIV